MQDEKLELNNHDNCCQMKNNDETFRAQMHEAFDNFKVSTELEQTKRLRQIGDLLSNQQHIMKQNNYNEKNYKIFQRTSQQMCEQLKNIVDLLGVQNALNFQEEVDKNSIALVSAQAEE